MRRKIFATVLFACLLSLALIVSAHADVGTVTGSDVNVRSGPGVNYAVIACLDKGTEVIVNDRSNASWYSITVNGKTGFMSSQYLSVEEVPAAPAQSGGTKAVINAMYVRFRSGPGTDYAILGEYNTGTEVTVTGTSGDWSEVIINNQSGFVFTSYISASAPTAAPAPTPTPPPAQQQPQPSVTPTEQKQGTITGDYVRFRSGPDTSYDILGTYNRGKAITVTGISGEWTAAIIDGKSGFVFSSYVSTSASAPSTPAAPAKTEKAGYIKGNNVRFRSGPGTGYNIIGEYNYGKALTITGSSGDWSEVTIDGKSGFVCSTYVAEGSIEVPPVTDNTDLGTQIAVFAQQFVGYNYVWGANSPDEGFDCSGLVYYSYGHFGYTLHRVADDIAKKDGNVVSGDLKPGDILCFYSGNDYVGHVGIYIGDGRFVHASSSTTGVIISELSGYYNSRGYIAKRIV